MPTSKVEQIQVGVFLEDSQDIEMVREALKSLNIKKSDIIKGGVKEAIELVSNKKSPPYLIIDVSKSELPVSDLNRLADLCDPTVNLIAVGLRNDVGLYRDLMRLGISDYLVKPLFSDILNHSLKT
ncbi:MAG: fimbrial protein, partial [Proteobacteria bacterium]|nr:fimbrial protein [Pseudomonadota bacterium]